MWFEAHNLGVMRVLHSEEIIVKECQLKVCLEIFKDKFIEHACWLLKEIKFAS